MISSSDGGKNQAFFQFGSRPVFKEWHRVRARVVFDADAATAPTLDLLLDDQQLLSQRELLLTTPFASSVVEVGADTFGAGWTIHIDNAIIETR